jgi:hypothetical protein
MRHLTSLNHKETANMPTLTTIDLTAPSYWASYLINGDATGLNAVEKAACDAWLKSEGVFEVLDAVDAGFCWSHDASKFALAGDCQSYLCRVEVA